jgi:gliding motility-associated-like protein
MAQTTVTVGSGGTYPYLYDAINAINEGNLPGEVPVKDVIIQIVSSTVESQTSVLYQSGYNGTSDYSSVTIYPTGSGYVISCDFDGPLIELSKASNVVINGAVYESGNADLTLSNINTGPSASTIKFSESATNNIIRYCILKGSGQSASTGILHFSTTPNPLVGDNGNDGNLIEYNYITAEGSNRPVNAIFSLGEAGFENSGNTISNNYIYNFLNPGLSSSGIFISSFSTDWTISDNSFYETSSFVPTGTLSPAFYGIQINNTTGSGFIITGNHIGGSSATSAGTWTKTNAKNNVFYGIYLNAGTATASSIQNNTIRNFAWGNSSSASWTAIHVAAGDVIIGTITGNTIGSTTGTGSITVNSGASSSNIYGINIATSGTSDCRNNTVGSILAVNGASNSTNIYGISKGAAAGTVTISGNLIGSLTQSNSINSSSQSTGSAQSVFGISCSGTGTVTISENTIANLTNGTTNSNTATAGLVTGIRAISGACTISDNTIHDLTISNANNSSSNTASASGIALSGSTLKTVTGNIVYNIKNTYSSFTGSITGIYFTGNTGANIVNNNFIYGLQVTGASSTSASLYGIKAGAGAATYYNNIISLGGNTQTNIYGIYETGASGEDNNLYFNSVYLNGSPAAGTNNSYALYNASSANNRVFSNNILHNARANSGATGKHYSIYVSATAGTLTIDHNDYYANGSGGILGILGSTDVLNLSDWQTATSQDAASLSSDPAFSNPGSSSSDDYHPATVLTGVTVTGITTDFNGAARNTPPTMGAFEGGTCANPTNGGTISSDHTGCTPYDSPSFTSVSPATGYTGVSLQYKWQKSTTDGTSGFSDIAGASSATYDPGALTQTTWFKRLARVSCIIPDDWSGAAVSNVVKVTVNSLPTANAITGANQVCIGSTVALTPNAVGTAPLTYTWASSNNSIASVNASGVVSGLSDGNTGITYTVKDGNNCSSVSPSYNVTVNALPGAGLTVGGPGFICTGSAATITIDLSQSGVNYQLRNDNANELVGSAVGGTGGTINLPTGVMTNNITYNIFATNATTSCSIQLSEKETVNTDPLSVGGSISGTASVTYGSATGTMTLAGYTGTIQRWEKRLNSGSWTSISNTSTTYSETPSGAGSWDYRAVVKNGTCNEANSVLHTVTVDKAALLITADDKSKDYGAALPVLTVTYTGLVNGDIGPATPPSVSTTATASSPVATYPITASGAADPNYNITYAPGTLTVNKVSLQIRADDKNKVYGAALPALTVTYTGLVNGDIAPSTPPSVNTTATVSSPAGSYPITASGASDPNYNISYTGGTMTVTQASLLITADNKTKIYGEPLPALTVSYTGLVNGDVAPSTTPSVSTTATASSPAGNYSITASGAGDPNYSITYAGGTFTISKASLTIQPDNKVKDYGAALPVLTVSYTGLVNGDIAPSTPASVNTSATASSPVGSYTLTASGAGDPNYNISYLTGNLTVAKVSLVITADNKTKMSGAPVPVLTASYTGLVNGDTAPATLPVLSTSATVSSPIGSYVINISGADDPNYNISYVSGTLSVVEAYLTITAEDKSITYGGDIPVFTVTYTGLIDGDTAPATPPSVTTSASPGSPAGTYTITASGAADPKYSISYVQGTLTIGKAELLIAAENKTRLYGEDNPALTYTYTGLVNGDMSSSTSPSITTTAASTSNTGNYPITISSASDPNYNITYQDGILIIQKAVLSVTADNKSKTYGESNPILTITYSGFAGTDDKTSIDSEPAATTTAAQSSSAGTYPITAAGGSDNNYSFSYADGVLTISKANLIFTADNISREYNTPNPGLTYTITGFVNSESQTVLDVLPVLSTTAIQSSSAGTYPITISGGSDNNYDFSFISGIFAITKANQVITFTDIPEKLLVTKSYNLAASSTSGLVVSFESLNNEFAIISGNSLTGISRGNAGIRAYHSGDQNYYSAEVIATVEIYSTHKDILNLFTPNNDGINDYWELPDLATWGNCNVKVYNRWGKLVFDKKAYDNRWDGTSNGNPLPEGPYYYIIDTENSGVVKGTVNIVR